MKAVHESCPCYISEWFMHKLPVIDKLLCKVCKGMQLRFIKAKDAFGYISLMV